MNNEGRRAAAEVAVRKNMHKDKTGFHIVHNAEQQRTSEESEKGTEEEPSSQQTKDETIKEKVPAQQETATEKRINSKKSFWNWLKPLTNNALFATILGGIIITLLTSIVSSVVVFHDMKRDVSALSESIAEMQKSMIDRNDWLVMDDKIDDGFEDINQSLKELDNVTNELDKRLAVEESRFKNISRGTASEKLISCVSSMNNSDTVFSSGSDLWDNKDILIYDEKSGEQSSAEETADTKLLCSYIDENKSEVFFYGQFNRENRWEGNCLINVYTNGKLRLITDALYSGGVLLSYRQVLASSNSSGEGTWLISKRNCDNNANNGDTWSYYFKEDIKKSFISDDVSVVDILSVNDFKDMLESDLEGFYHGCTSNGKYNDNSGKAYLIKYAKDGTIRTFYTGMFADGRFNDNTGQAWEIARDADIFDSGYVYKKGCFQDSKFDWSYKNKVVETDLTEEMINEKMRNVYTKCSIRWYGFEKT